MNKMNQFTYPAEFKKENLGKAQRDINIAMDVKNHGRSTHLRKDSAFRKAA